MILKKNYLYSFIILIIIFTTSCTTVTRYISLPKPIGEMDKKQIINTYFIEKELDPVEGIWVTDNNQYEIAILKNTSKMNAQYDYVGVLTESQSLHWKVGETKILLKKTVSNSVLTGIYYLGNKEEYGTSFLMPNENMIEVYLPTGPYGIKQKTFLLRTYPPQVPKSGISTDTHVSVKYHTRNPAIEKSENKFKSIGRAVFVVKTNKGHGTGFIIDTEGYAVTSYHVLNKQDEFDAVFSDGKIIRSRVIRVNPDKDLALIKLSGSDYPFLPIADNRKAKVGEEVYVIGTPLSLGLTETISKGIVSGIRKSKELELIQTDASINPGNSGGPLLDNTGSVLGVIALKISAAGIEGLGFAVSGNDLISSLGLIKARE